jgi:peroxiredoxin
MTDPTPKPDLPPDTGGGGLRWQPIVLIIAGGMLVAALFIHKRNKRLEKLEKEGGGGTTANKVWRPEKPEIKPEEWPFKGKFLGSWVALLKDPDKKVRRETAAALSGIEPEGRPHLAPLVLKLLGDEDADVRQLSAYILGNIKPDSTSALGPLSTALNDSDKRVRNSAATALGNLQGDPAAIVAALGPALHDKDKNVRRAVATSLVQVGRASPDVLGALLRDALKDKDPDVRQLAQYIQTNTKAEVAAADDAQAPVKREKRTRKPEKVEVEIGKAIPEIQGEDLDGIRFKLSEYRGKIVVLVFWEWENIAQVRTTSLAERLKDKRSVLIGVNCNTDKLELRERMKQQRITWRSFGDADGAISDAWGVDLVPTVYVIDFQGILRYEINSNRELNGAISKLLRELEAFERGGK